MVLLGIRLLLEKIELTHSCEHFIVICLFVSHKAVNHDKLFRDFMVSSSAQQIFFQCNLVNSARYEKKNPREEN